MVGGGNQVRLIALHESSADMQQPQFQLPAGQTVSALDCSSASGLVSIGTQVGATIATLTTPTIPLECSTWIARPVTKSHAAQQGSITSHLCWGLLLASPMSSCTAFQLKYSTIPLQGLYAFASTINYDSTDLSG